MSVWLTSGQFSSLMTSLLFLNLIQISLVRLSETESLLDRRQRQRRPTCSLRPGGLTHSGINHSGNRHVLYFFLSHTLTVHQTTHTHKKPPCTDRQTHKMQALTPTHRQQDLPLFLREKCLVVNQKHNAASVSHLETNGV